MENMKKKKKDSVTYYEKSEGRQSELSFSGVKNRDEK